MRDRRTCPRGKQSGPPWPAHVKAMPRRPPRRNSNKLPNQIHPVIQSLQRSRTANRFRHLRHLFLSRFINKSKVLSQKSLISASHDTENSLDWRREHGAISKLSSSAQWNRKNRSPANTTGANRPKRPKRSKAHAAASIYTQSVTEMLTYQKTLAQSKLTRHRHPGIFSEDSYDSTTNSL